MTAFQDGFISEFNKHASSASNKAADMLKGLKAKFDEMSPATKAALGISAAGTGAAVVGSIASRRKLKKRMKELDAQETAKVAFFKNVDKDKLKTALHAAAVGVAGAPLVSKGVGKLLTANRMRRTKKELKKLNPDGIADHPLFEKQFSTIKRFSPKAASDPLTAAHLIKKLQHKPNKMIDSLNAAADLERDHMRTSEMLGRSAGIIGKKILEADY